MVVDNNMKWVTEDGEPFDLNKHLTSTRAAMLAIELVKLESERDGTPNFYSETYLVRL